MIIATTPESTVLKEYVSWSNSYSIRIPVIDEQHKRLLNFVNDLYNHATGNEKEERVYFNQIIQEIVQYIKFHFSKEEKYMNATRFPGYAAHKKAHDEFTMRVIESIKDFGSGKRLVLEKLARFLKDWVLSHIAVMDTQYAAYFRQIATRKADGKLSITMADIKS